MPTRLENLMILDTAKDGSSHLKKDVMKPTILILTLSFLINTVVKAQSAAIAKSFTGHKEAILGIAQSPNGKYLL